MKRDKGIEKLLFEISRFVSFFWVISLVSVTMIFVLLKDTVVNEELLRQNVMDCFLWTLIMTVAGICIDEFRRRRSFERPLGHILETLDKLRHGDFSARVDLNDREFSSTGFHKIGKRINQLANELSGVETLRSDFIANVSHEMKTPLAVIQNYAAILRDPALPEDRRQEYTEKISETTHRLADLVSNVLKLNKLENQRIYPETRVFDLGEQLAECLLSFESAWEAKALELDCEIEEDLLVEADPELLSLVWNNLFSNAIKFTPEGGKISLRLRADGDWLAVTVSDTGCGMSKETGAHIFEKFYQGDTAHATQGNGLGLALVKRVVDITGGVISVASAPGKGSTFTVRLGRAKNGTV